jgi:TolA-binding protein
MVKTETPVQTSMVKTETPVQTSMVKTETPVQTSMAIEKMLCLHKKEKTQLESTISCLNDTLKILNTTIQNQYDEKNYADQRINMLTDMNIKLMKRIQSLEYK